MSQVLNNKTLRRTRDASLQNSHLFTPRRLLFALYSSLQQLSTYCVCTHDSRHEYIAFYDCRAFFLDVHGVS